MNTKKAMFCDALVENDCAILYLRSIWEIFVGKGSKVNQLSKGARELGDAPKSIEVVEPVQLIEPDESMQSAEAVEVAISRIEQSMDSGEPLSIELSDIADSQPSDTPDADTDASKSKVDSLDKSPSIEPKVVHDSAKPRAKSRRGLATLVFASVVVFVGVGFVSWLAVRPADADEVQDNVILAVETPKHGITPTVVDGTVELQVGNSDWQALTTDAKLSEGSKVRTGGESRAILTVDDGSVVRLDSDTVIELASLAVDNIEINQLSGSVYSRVVASDRKYTVNIDGTLYESIGTAFVTTRTDSQNGVKVFQSSVRVNDISELVSEGRQYYGVNEDINLQGKITDIDIDQLSEDTFISWNLEEDEKDAKFKDKLGVLLSIRQHAEAKKIEQQAETDVTQEEVKPIDTEAEAEQVLQSTEKKSLTQKSSSRKDKGKNYQKIRTNSAE